MVLDKVLASVQIGGAKVDTVVDDEVFVPDETVSGTVVVEGGEADQEIEGLVHHLVADLPDGDKATVTLDTHKISGPFTIHEGERKEIPFEWTLHPQAPPTELDIDQPRAEVWIDTGLSIDKAIDADDTDYLRVGPTPTVRAAIDAMDELGLELFRVTADEDWLTKDLNRENDHQVVDGYDREFDFRETSRYDGPGFNEYQLHFLPNPDLEETDVLIELEQYSGGEVFGRMTIDHDDLDVDGLAADLRREIEALA